VRFTYDANGLLEVEAQVPLTGQTLQRLIQRDSQVMDEGTIKRALERMKRLKIHPRDKQENAYLIHRAKRLYEDNLGVTRSAIGHALTRFEVVRSSQDEHQIRQARSEFKSYLDSIDTGFIL
jgi:molecular chaperone HscC